MPNNPYTLVLEFSRAQKAGDPFAFEFREQEYQLRMEGGVFRSAPFPWNPGVIADLQELERPSPEGSAVQRLGNQLRSFLEQLDFGRHEAELEHALAQGRPVHLSVRSAAAELYALPWSCSRSRAPASTWASCPAAPCATSGLGTRPPPGPTPPLRAGVSSSPGPQPEERSAR